jgi:alpha-L-fucosidase
MMSIVRRGALLAAAASASTTGTMASDLPVPTPELLNWAQQEIGVIIHYNMETQCTNVSNPQHFCVGVGGSAGGWMPPASFFNPDKLSTDNWLAAAHSLGAKYAVMVAQHCSGFSLWDSSVKAAVDFDYTYNVEHSPFKGSIIKDFIASCAKYGIEPGFYYSLNQNYYLDVAGGKVLNTPKLVPHQVRVNQTTYNKIALEQMRQLWTLFGPIFEVWFDGGDDLPGINSMLESLPNLKHSVHFGGTAKTNNLRWIGTESGHPSAAYPIWSTATDGGVDQHGQKCGPSNLYCGGGSPNGSRWAPAESDTTLQENDAWFYKPGVSIRPLEDMKAVYHDTVGHNSNLLLDIAPDNTGTCDRR